MDLRLTVENPYCKARNLALVFLLSVFVMVFAYFTSASYLFLGPMDMAFGYIVLLSLVNTVLVYLLVVHRTQDDTIPTTDEES